MRVCERLGLYCVSYKKTKSVIFLILSIGKIVMAHAPIH